MWALIDVRTGKPVGLARYLTRSHASSALARLMRDVARGKRQDLRDILPYLIPGRTRTDVRECEG